MKNELTIENSYYITLQPICDSGMRHIADQVLYRSSETANFSAVNNNSIAKVNTTFLENSLEKLAGNRKLFFNAPKEWIIKPELLPPYPNKIIIEVAKELIDQPKIISALKNLQNLGYDIALNNFTLNNITRPLLELVTIIKINIKNPLTEEELAEYKHHKISLLAEKVTDLETFNRVKAMGFELFKGCFYARPETYKEASHKNCEHNKKIQISIISELQAVEPSYELLENLITQDPQLAFMLIKYVNSSALSHKNEATTILQALNTLSLDNIRNIVTTIILANNGPASRILLPKALTRAYMCQSLAEKTTGLDSQSGFMLGLVSMMNLLMNIDLAELIEKLPLTLEIKDALILGKGELGKLLNLVIAFEEANIANSSPQLISKLNGSWLASQKQSNEIISKVIY